MGLLEEQLRKCVDVYVIEKKEELREELTDAIQQEFLAEYKEAIFECKRNIDTASDYLRYAEEAFNNL